MDDEAMGAQTITSDLATYLERRDDVADAGDVVAGEEQGGFTFTTQGGTRYFLFVAKLPE